ncbi:hypothetical protein [Microbacterium aureliae]
MGDGAVDELRMLRARAYGPDADILDDADALERLRELEDEARRAALDAPAPAAAPTPATPPPARVESAADDGTTSLADAAPDLAPDDVDVDPAGPVIATPRRRWYRLLTPRRLALLWVVSLVFAGLVASAVTLALTSDGHREVAVLQEAEDAEWPTNIFGTKANGAAVFEDLAGLMVVAMPGWSPGAAEAMCLYVVDSNPARGSISTGGCAAGSFPATGALTVTTSSPRELRDRFELGVSLQFILEGDRVRVLSDTP